MQAKGCRGRPLFWRPLVVVPRVFVQDYIPRRVSRMGDGILPTTGVVCSTLDQLTIHERELESEKLRNYESQMIGDFCMN